MSEKHRHNNLAAALGRIPSGLFILTARQDSLEMGMLASWVQQCSFEPPRLTLAMHRERSLSTWIKPGSLFGLHILRDDQTNLVSHFARGVEAGPNAFHGFALEQHDDNKPPILKDVLAYLECRAIERWTAGDHDLILADVVAGGLHGQGQPMVHIRKNGLRY